MRVDCSSSACVEIGAPNCCSSSYLYELVLPLCISVVMCSLLPPESEMAWC